MFKGISEIKLDDKGRFALPKRVRQQSQEGFGSKFVVTVNPFAGEKCLFLYPLPRWSEIAEAQAQWPDSDQRVRKLVRLLFGYAEELSLDKSGRVLLSQPLRDYASLRRDMVVVGHVQKMELWDKQLWTRHLEDNLLHADDPFPIEIKL